MNRPYRIGEQRSHADHFDILGQRFEGRLNCVGDQHFLDRAAANPVRSPLGEHSMADGRIDITRSSLLEHLPGADQGATGDREIIDNQQESL